MESGYSMSPMFALFLEYSQEEEEEASVSRRVAFFATSPNLDLSDMEEHEENQGRVTILLYSIKKDVWMRINRTMNELQVFVKRMAALVTERPRGKHFIVDPEEMIMRTLTKSQSLAQLQVAWLMMAQRFSAAQRFIAKYIQEYQALDVLALPISTSASVLEALALESTLENKLKLAYVTIPRHAGKLSESDQLTLQKYRSWQDTKVVPNWLDSLETASTLGNLERKEKRNPSPINESDAQSHSSRS